MNLPNDDVLLRSTDKGLRRVVAIVALLNLAYFAGELNIAFTIGSISLLADSVDFFEDASVNLLIRREKARAGIQSGRGRNSRAMRACTTAGSPISPTPPAQAFALKTQRANQCRGEIRPLDTPARASSSRATRRAPPLRHAAWRLGVG